MSFNHCFFIFVCIPLVMFFIFSVNVDYSVVFSIFISILLMSKVFLPPSTLGTYLNGSRTGTCPGFPPTHFLDTRCVRTVPEDPRISVFSTVPGCHPSTGPLTVSHWSPSRVRTHLGLPKHTSRRRRFVLVSTGRRFREAERGSPRSGTSYDPSSLVPTERTPWSHVDWRGLRGTGDES